MRWKFTPYIEDSSANSTFRRLLEEDERLEELVSAYPTLEGLKKTITQRKFSSSNRKLLAAVLKRQNANSASETSLSNISKLADEKTFTVTTGHQLNIFSGPAFFIYKISHAISLANALSEELVNETVVPVYWMASEDHDLEEINHLNIYKETFSWGEAYTGAVGRMSVTKLYEVLEQWKDVMRWEDDHPRYTLFKNYVQQANLTAATRYLVNELFGDQGIVVIDADDQDLKALFAPQMKEELTTGVGLQELTAVESQLEKANLKAQIHARDINLFYLTANDRLRLTHDNDDVITVGGAHRWEREELLKELNEHPQRFSPNVVLRPVYQEVILPNIAYVGGPGELTYWLQLKPLFDNLNVPFPVLMPRNGATILAGHQVKKLTKLKVNVSDLNVRDEDLVAKWIAENAEVDTALHASKIALEEVFKKIQSQLEQVDKSLVKKGEGALVRSQKELEGLEKAMQRAVKSKNDVAINQLMALKQSLFPNGSPQERHQNYFALEASFGKSVINELVENFSPFNPGMHVISPEV